MDGTRFTADHSSEFHRADIPRSNETGRVRLLAREPPERQLVSADRIDLALPQCPDAGGVRVEREGPR